jgi:uncharacterized membrane protein (Fun14 family)
MINVKKMADGQSNEAKQLLFIVTIGVLSVTLVYYIGQIKLNKMKVKELEQTNAELHLSN